MTTSTRATRVSGLTTGLSRRNLLLSLALAAPAALLPKSAHAQGDVWREYRSADLPFRIEFPGEPKVETDEPKDEAWTKEVEAKFESQQAMFGVSWTKWRNDQPLERTTRQWRKFMEKAFGPFNREESLVMNGFPARDFIRQSDNINGIYRYVFMGKETILLSIVGGADIHRSPTMRRFFDSFKLLRSAP